MYALEDRFLIIRHPSNHTENNILLCFLLDHRDPANGLSGEDVVVCIKVSITQSCVCWTMINFNRAFDQDVIRDETK